MTTTKRERREAIDGIRDDLEEIDADLIGLREEFRDVKERLKAALADRDILRTRLAEWRSVKCS
jgi:hypothetical protein